MAFKDIFEEQRKKLQNYFGVGKPGLGTFGQQASNVLKPIVNRNIQNYQKAGRYLSSQPSLAQRYTPVVGPIRSIASIPRDIKNPQSYPRQFAVSAGKEVLAAAGFANRVNPVQVGARYLSKRLTGRDMGAPTTNTIRYGQHLLDRHPKAETTEAKIGATVGSIAPYLALPPVGMPARAGITTRAGIRGAEAFALGTARGLGTNKSITESAKEGASWAPFGMLGGAAEPYAGAVMKAVGGKLVNIAPRIANKVTGSNAPLVESSIRKGLGGAFARDFGASKAISKFRARVPETKSLGTTPTGQEIKTYEKGYQRVKVPNETADFLFKNGRLPKPGEVANNYQIKGTAELVFDPKGKLTSWDTDNPEFYRILKSETPKFGMSIEDVGLPKKPDALSNEARKYKSAEEFVRSQIKRDLVSEVQPVKITATDRTMFTTASARAKSRTLTDKLVDAAKRNQKQFDRDVQKTIPQLQKEVDDLRAFAAKEGASEGSLGIALKEELIATKSQLTDIWNKSQSPTPKTSKIPLKDDAKIPIKVDALSNEARKGDYHALVNAEGGGTKFVKAEGAKPVTNKYGLDLFVSKNKDGLWVVSEAKSGKALTSTYQTRTGAVDAIDGTLARAKERGYDINKTIDESVSQYGTSPRYKTTTPQIDVIKQATEARKAQLQRDGFVDPVTNSLSPQSKGITPKVEGAKLTDDVNRIMEGTKPQEKSLVSRVKESDRYSPEIRKMVSGEYVPTTNKQVISDAKKLVYLDPQAAEQRALNPQNATDQAIGIELFNRYMDEGNVAKANGVLNATSGTNEGQMIQILSQYDKTSPAGAVRTAQNIIKNYNEVNPNKTLSLADDQIKKFYDMASEVQKMPQGRERGLATKKLFEEINSLVPSSIQDKAITLWKAGLLTSPRTTLRNIIGNSVHGLAEFVKDIPATLVDRLLSKKTGKRSLTFTTRGIIDGSKKGFKSAKDIMKYGFDPEDAISKYDVQKINWGESGIGKTLGKYTDFVFNSLGAQDKPFYHSAFARSLYDQAGAIAINTGKGGDAKFIKELVDNPTQNMLKIATQDASIATFKDKNALGKLASQAKQSLGNYRGIAEIVAPFTGVPTSIAGQMVSYSPVGLAKGGYNAVKVLAGKMPEIQRQAAQEIGRGIVGTGLLGIGAYLSSKGLMLGNPKDSKEYEQWRLEGKQPNSVFVFGKWRSINSIGPELLVLLAGVQAQQDLNKDVGAGVMLGNVGKTIVGQSSLQGVQTNLNALTNPQQYGKQTVQNLVGSTIPNIVNDTGKALDKTQREINGYVVEPLKARIPLIRNTLLPKRDVLGNEVPQEPTGVNAFIDLFNSKTPVSNPVVNELSRLNMVNMSATPSKLSNKQTVFGQKIELTPAELDQLEKSSGGAVSKTLNDIVTDPNYSKLSDSDKKDIVDNAVSDVRTSTKESLASGLGVDADSITGKYKLQIEKTQFENSGDKSKWIGDNYWYKTPSGESGHYSRSEYDSKLRKNKMSLYENKKTNYKEWLNLAQEQLSSLEQQWQEADDLQKLDLENDYINLLQKIEKYQSYGGFTKGKKAKTSSLTGISNLTSGIKIPIRTAKKPTFKNISATPKIAIKSTKPKLISKATLAKI